MIGAITAGLFSTGVAASTNSYESISTTTLGSAQASVTLSSIPSGYKHLQVRYSAQDARATYGVDAWKIIFNGDTGANYSWHYLNGNGASASANSSGGSDNYIQTKDDLGTTTGGTFGAGILDILEYTNTSIYKTARNLGGVDLNGTIASVGGSITLTSGNWRNTAAITSITFTPYTGANLSTGSKFALYGIKG